MLLGSLLTLVIAANPPAQANVRIDTGEIKIYLENKDSVVFRNNIKENAESWVAYSYAGYFPRIKYHKVTWDGPEDHDSFALINNANGKIRTFFESEPVFYNFQDSKPHADYVATVKSGYHGPSALNIYEVKDSLHLVWSNSPGDSPCWEFVRAFWSSPTQLVAQKRFAGANKSGDKNRVMLEFVELKNGKWVYNERLVLKADCTLDSAKTQAYYRSYY